MKRIVNYIVISFLFLQACGGVASPENAKEAVEKKQEQKEPLPEKTQPSISLDNGKKWIANSATTEGIRKMIIRIDEFTAVPSGRNCIQLKDDLEAEFNTILKKCTMKGEAHNQLHNFLLPIDKSIKNLGTPEAEDCSDAARTLKKLLVEYDIYFQ